MVTGQIILLIFLFFALPISLKSQVTIGSGEKAVLGSVLDLKEYLPTASNATATRGMMLPRVVLTDIDKLYPMFTESDPNYSGANFDIQNARHTGLLVFHTKDDVEIQAGAYVWDGVKWKKLGTPAEPPIEDGDIVKDHENNEYPIGDFNEAGWWTLQNTRAKTLLNGDPILFSHENDAANPDREDLIRIFYPNGLDNSTNEPITYDPKYGMLYSFSAALNGEPLPEGDPIIRGLCPKGWHVPTDKDWMLLEKELFNNFHLYSDNLQQSDLGSWVDYWEDIYSTGWRGKHGMVAKGTTQVEINTSEGESVIPVTKGFSKPSSEKGFDVYLVGVAVDGKKGVQQISDLRYGTGAQFWASTPWSSGSGKSLRKLNATENAFGRLSLPPYYLISLRCKKNVE